MGRLPYDSRADDYAWVWVLINVLMGIAGIVLGWNLGKALFND